MSYKKFITFTIIVMEVEIIELAPWKLNGAK
jgi:hypothetical protein